MLNNKYYILIAIWLIIIGISFPLKSFFTPSFEGKTDKSEFLLENEDFSEEELIKLIKKLNFRFPEIVLAQAILETNYFSSSVFKEGKNLFGMKQAFSRVNISEGTKNNHAYYSNWKESVIDYGFYYSTYLYQCKTEKELLLTLNKIYAVDPLYDSKLKNIIKTYELKTKFQ